MEKDNEKDQKQGPEKDQQTGPAKEDLKEKKEDSEPPMVEGGTPVGKNLSGGPDAV
jgi:hypothetical protein